MRHKVWAQRTHCPTPTRFCWCPSNSSKEPVASSYPGPWKAGGVQCHFLHAAVLITETTLLTEAGPLGQRITLYHFESKLHPLRSGASASPERFLFVWSWEDLLGLASSLPVYWEQGPSSCGGPTGWQSAQLPAVARSPGVTQSFSGFLQQQAPASKTAWWWEWHPLVILSLSITEAP